MDLNRYLLPAQAYKTYEVKTDSSHWRKASCAEVGCNAHRDGWTTTLDVSDEQQAGNAHYIRRTSGRRFREEQVGPTVFRFHFEPGQMCFRAARHELPNGRQEIYIARGGDKRGNPTGERRIHTRPLDWVEDMSLHLDAFAEFQKRG